MHRLKEISAIENTVFDIAVIGGGITGAGILYEGGKAGYSCILLEKNDFASGTSSRSAKLVHGGLRYLKYGRFGMVREGLRERNYLLHQFPHLVKPLRFLLPVYGSKVPYSIAMWLYERFGRDKALPSYCYLGKDETINHLPWINTRKLKGSFVYYDAVTNDARLTNEVIHLANENYQSAALNYCEFLSAEDKGDYFSIRCKDHIEDRLLSVRSKYIVNAGGPWVDEILNRLQHTAPIYSAPSKGAHLVFSSEKLPLPFAVAFSSYANDNRMLYAIPWENNCVIVGATDTEYRENPDKVQVTDDDVRYILNALALFAPSLDISRKDIAGSFAGLRPLINEEKQSSDRTRDYRSWWSHKRIINVLGGKMTSFHSMAEKTVEKIRLEFSPLSKPTSKTRPQAAAGSLNFYDKMKEELALKYGRDTDLVLSISAEHPSFTRYITGTKIYPSEIIYFIRHQASYHMDDVLTRRLSISYGVKKQKDKESLVSGVARIMEKELHWTAEEKSNEINSYCERVCNCSN